MDDQSNIGGADFVLPPVSPTAHPQKSQAQSDDQSGVSDNNAQTQDPQSAATPPPQQSPLLTPPVSNSQAGSSNDGHSHVVGAVPEIADDLDLIEKEWVNKAKDIVAKTQGDPHTRSAALGKVKVEYLKRRFNKQSKEDQ